MTTASHRRRASALRATKRRHVRASSGHAVVTFHRAHRQDVAAVAGALADAFLATRWRPAPLLTAAHTVLGARPRWLVPLVTATVRAYRTAPADRPRELAAFLADLDRIPSDRHPAPWARRQVRPAVVRIRLAAPVRVVRLRWDTPVIDHLGALAALLEVDPDHLDWYADRREINRQARDERLRHYRYQWLPHRLIEAPKPRLRALQRRLLDEVLGPVPVHGAAHGFVPGRGAHSYAAVHAGRPTVVRLDLASFFSTITAGRVYGLWRGAGYPEPVAHALTALTTTRTPAAVLRDCPDPVRAALLRRPHLPQGAPTSPALANLCAYRLDRRLTGLAERFGLRYSRYADDLAFSGPLGERRTTDLIAYAGAVVTAEGFRLRPAKTRVRGRADRQELAGLVVNQHPAVSRVEYDRLRAILHDAATHGLAEANRDGHPDFAAHLTGRVAWAAHRHPARAAKLHRLLTAALA